MAPSVYLSPTTDTALEHAIAQVRAIQAANPLAAVCFLLPTAEDTRLLRGRLGDSMGVRIYQFYRLGQAILNQAGWPNHEIGDAAIHRLVRDLLAEMQQRGELTSFAPVWEKPGFIQVTLDWLREMKTQGILPEDVQANAETTGLERDCQLATLYTRYQTFLQQGQRSDADGLLWLAAEALEQNPRLFQDSGPLLVLGFDQFNPIQLRILRQLAARVSGLELYLLWDEARPADSLALTRLRRTRDDVAAALRPQVHLLPDTGKTHPVLADLRRTLFEPVAAPASDVDPEAIWAVATPSRETEVRWALRAIKQLILDGVSPEEIALLAPQPRTYQQIVRAVTQEYGLPLRLDQPLAQNPAVAALLNLLSLYPDFPWQHTFDVLRSPYIQQRWLNSQQIAHLDRLSRERPVVAGRDQWRYALHSLQLAEKDQADDELGPLPLVAALPPEELAAIEAGLDAFFDHLTPAESASYERYTLWLQEAVLGLFGEEEEEADPGTAERPSLNIVACCQRSPYAVRDLQALAVVTRALRGLLAAISLRGGIAGDDVSWDTYRTDLLNGLQAITLSSDPAERAVRFGPLEAGRNRPVDHLFVLGLAEGEFPRPPAPDVFYAAAERESHPLPLLRLHPADDACLWWQVVGNCRRSLALLRPRLDNNGAPWLPSPYWGAVLERVAGLEQRVIQLPIAEAPVPEHSASPNELLVALAMSRARGVPPPLRSAWQNAQDAYQVMERRRSWLHLGDHEGVLGSSDLLADLQRRYGADHVWSASRLGRYGACPYLFFAEAVLALEALPDPVAGIDAMQLGSLLHAILERLYRRLTHDGLAPAPANQESVLACLESTCQELFPTAPQRYGFRPGELWRYEQKEMQRLLRALVIWECQENGDAPRFHPDQQELRFGMKGDALPSLWVGETFYLHGVIDRLDRDAAGNLRVIDYKSGSTTYTGRQIEEGLALQTALYTLAARQVVDAAAVAESYYLHIPTRKRSGQLRFPDDEGKVQAAVERAVHFVRQVRAGRFPAAPGERSCPESCDMVGLCRRTRQSIAKARRASQP